MNAATLGGRNNQNIEFQNAQAHPLGTRRAAQESTIFLAYMYSGSRSLSKPVLAVKGCISISSETLAANELAFEHAI